MKHPTQWLSALTFLAIGAAAPALGQPAPDTKNVIAGSAAPWVPMAEWETAGQLSVASGAEAVGKAPKSAVKYQEKTFALPTGTIHILEFTKKGGGVLHKITTETELYLMKGSATVGVHGADETLTEGDAVNLPTGILRGKAGNPEDATVFVWEVGNTSKAPVSAAVRMADVKDTVLPPGPDGVSISLKRYTFDGNSIRRVTQKGPGHTPPNAHDMDSILYILSGHMRITIGDTVTDVKAGDAVREPMGVKTSWEVLEESSFLSTSGPVSPASVQ